MLTATLSTHVSPSTHTLCLRGNEFVTTTLIAHIGDFKPVTSEPRRPARHMGIFDLSQRTTGAVRYDPPCRIRARASRALWAMSRYRTKQSAKHSRL